MSVLSTLSLDPAIADLVAVALSLLFAKAAVDKFMDLARFRQLLEAYDLLPAKLAEYGAVVVPAIESALAVGLLLGCFGVGSRPLAGLLAACVLGAYGVAIALNLLRGRKDLDCGCAPAGERRPIAAWMPARNAVLALSALTLTLPIGTRDLGFADMPLLLGGVITCALLYATLDFLLGKVAPTTANLRVSR